MDLTYKQKQLIDEEQAVLDKLIRRLDQLALKLNADLTRTSLEQQKAKDMCLPDTYGDLIDAVNWHERIVERLDKVYEVRDELYSYRLFLDIEDAELIEENCEVKVGLHSLQVKGHDYIVEWTRPFCRHFILNQEATEYDGYEHDNRTDGLWHTHYQLKRKLKTKLHFDTVEEVVQLYPAMTEEDERIIADGFLEELLSRRSEQAFRNIVFSIQKKQGEIIQAPFEQNLIIQGNAGSGKSMIMLHRLPILLTDNKATLQRTSIYIITPSETYTRMADEMRHQLEISDLEMGTLRQYYDKCIEKYGRWAGTYGNISYNYELPLNRVNYIYSDECIRDIQAQLDEVVKYSKIDLSKVLRKFSIRPHSSSLSRYSEVNKTILDLQDILKVNTESLRRYHSYIRQFWIELQEFARFLSNRRSDILRDYNRRINSQKKEIQENQRKAIGLNTAIKANQTRYENYQKMITSSEEMINQLMQEKTLASNDQQYYDSLIPLKVDIQELMVNTFSNFKQNYEDMKPLDIYKVISEISTIIGFYHSGKYKCYHFSEKYDQFAGNVGMQFIKLEKSVDQLSKLKFQLVDEYRYIVLKRTSDSLIQMMSTAVSRTYSTIMLNLGIRLNTKNEIIAIPDSPYLYLQVLYQFLGVPNALSEKLITIDEAQGVAPQEIDLIRNVNGGKVILNLFGDEKQHFEGSKGIDNWNEITQGISFKRYDMNENYRNARQITEYCNRCFDMHMRAINLDGRGVHEIEGYETFISECVKLFRSAQNNGLRAIITRTDDEKRYLIDTFSNYKDSLHLLGGSEVEIHRNRWNVMTVMEARGLEFGSVIAVAGRMTPNERYIVYTRALDELLVYDEIIIIPESFTSGDDDGEKKDSLRGKEQKGETSDHRKKKEITEQNRRNGFERSELRDYFIKSGFEVVDQRAAGKFLWVIGSREKLQPIVEQACKKYGISGRYYSDSPVTRYRPAWRTKAKR